MASAYHCYNSDQHEVDVQYQHLQQILRRECFNVQLRVLHEFCKPTDDGAELTQLGFFESFHYSDLIVIEKLMDNGLEYLEKTLPDTLVPRYMIHKIFPHVMSLATRMVEENRSRRSVGNFLYVLPLVVEINVVSLSEEPCDDMLRIINESRREVKTELVSEADFQKALETTSSEELNSESFDESDIDVEGLREIINAQRSSSSIIIGCVIFFLLVGFYCVLSALFYRYFFFTFFFQ